MTCDICDTRRGRMRDDGIVRCRECNDRRPVKEPLAEECPRCGAIVEKVLWGHTNCPTCGLHWECC